MKLNNGIKNIERKKDTGISERVLDVLRGGIKENGDREKETEREKVRGGKRKVISYDKKEEKG